MIDPEDKQSIRIAIATVVAGGLCGALSGGGISGYSPGCMAPSTREKIAEDAIGIADAIIKRVDAEP